LAPSLANMTAIALPIPLLAPVTIAVCPFSFPISLHVLFAMIGQGNLFSNARQQSITRAQPNPDFVELGIGRATTPIVRSADEIQQAWGLMA